MSKAYRSKIHTYNDAEKYLGSKMERPCDFGQKNTRIVRQNESSIAVTLYDNIIIIFNKGKNTQYPYDGQFKDSQITHTILRAFQK